MSEPAAYRAFGLHIQSSLTIPGAQQVHVSATPDLIIEEGSIAEMEADEECSPYRRIGESLLFTMPGVARYLCGDRGKRLLVEPLPQASSNDVSAMLIATALPAILWMREEIVLHAAAAILPGYTKAIVFAGASGSGKSTILRHLLAAGANVVSDDTLCVRLRAGTVEVSGLPACTFLRPNGVPAAERLEVAVPADRQIECATLGALLVMVPSGTSQGDELVALSKPQALEALLTHRHRPRVPRLLGLESTLLSRFAFLAQSFPICNFHVGSTDSNACGEHTLLRLRSVSDYML